MGKYKYRTMDVQRVNWQKLSEQLSGGPLVLSVDVAKEDFVAAALRRDRTLLETIKWRHPEQTSQLVEQVMGLDVEVQVVLEPSGTYGDAVCWQFQRAGAQLFRISPKRVHDAAEIYDGVPSLHDPKAAYVIGRLHLEGVSRPWETLLEARRRLQALTRQLDHWGERQQRAHNRLEALLARHWPEATQCLGLNTHSLLGLLAHYGNPAAVARDQAAAGALLRRTGGHLLKEEKVTRLLESAATTVGLPCVEEESALIRLLAAEVLETQVQSRQLEREIAGHIASDKALGRQAALVGKNTAAVLYSTLGGAADYPNVESYLKAFGLNLKERSSGKHKGQLKLTKRGPGLARRYLYFAVLRWMKTEGPAKRWYEAKVARDGGIKKKALAGLMRKMAKALWILARGEKLEEDKLFGSRAPMQAA